MGIRLIIRAFVFLLVGGWLANSWAATDSYDYPFDDRFVATVIGTPTEYRADLPKNIPLKQRSITIFEDRKVPDFLWYDAKLRYSYALQKEPAPLVFLIAGTGGYHGGAKNKMMGRAFYQAGFHVVSLSSPTHSNFIVAASQTAVPGHVYRDAEDLYRVMEKIWDTIKKQAEVTDFYVTGYSLGGLNTGFVTWLDEQRKVFNFKKALMINPPVKLYNSVSILDRMLENIPGGEDNFYQFYGKLVKQFSEVYNRSEQLDLGEDALYRAYEALNIEDESLAALIGVSFRISSANLTLVSDIMTNYGYIKPKNVQFTKNTNPSEYGKISMRLGFTDYVHEYFLPFYRQMDPSITREGLIESMSLADIEDYLRNTDKIEVMHNENDVILAPGEIDFFRRVFGDRAKIYPTGGHCGNIDYRDNVAHMVNVFKQ